MTSDATKPKLWFVCPEFGAHTTHWMTRQVSWIDRLETEVICWANAEDADSNGVSVPVHVLPFEKEASNGRQRWWHRLRNAPGGNYYGCVGAERRALAALCERTQPDVILGHFGHAALRVLPVARQFEIPVVAYFHGLDISSMLRIRWYRASLLRHLRHFAATITVGTHQAQWLAEQGYPREHIHVIPSGTRTDLFVPAVPPPPAGPVRLIAVSRLVEQKGVDYSIRAFGEALRIRSDLHLHIVGDGPERDRLAVLVGELGLADKVSFEGVLASADVAKLMQQCHIFLQHSLCDRKGWVEGFGNSITEASACELPVVVTDFQGIRDQVVSQQTGLIVPPRDVQAMAEAICQLADDPAMRQRLGRAGRERAVANFDARISLERLEDVLRGAQLAGQKEAVGASV